GGFHMRRQAFLLVVALVVGLLGGCGSPTATVSGEVTVAGQPLEKGVISCIPADGNGGPVTASIENGKYQLVTVPGKKVVQISAPVVVGQRPEHNGPGAAMVEITEEGLPEKYNSKTELTFEAKSGSNTKDWPIADKLRVGRKGR